LDYQENKVASLILYKCHNCILLFQWQRFKKTHIHWRLVKK